MSDGLIIGVVGAVCTLLGSAITKLIDYIAGKSTRKAQANNLNMETVSKLQENYIDVLDQLAEERERYTKELNQMNERIAEQSKLIEYQKQQITHLQETIDRANEKIDKLSGMLQLTCIEFDCTKRKKYDIHIHEEL